MLFRRQLFFKINILKNSLKISIKMSNSIDPDQARRFVGPDLGQICLLRLSGYNISSYRFKPIQNRIQ